jgi:hypothetical protein
LAAEDLQRDQTYFLDRARRHNRFLHGWGIVDGLEVELSGPREIEVSPGLALDCAGNEIVVPAFVSVKLDAAAGEWFVALSYREAEENPTAALELETQMGVIRESFGLAFVEKNPASGHRGLGPGTPGCGEAHALCLASVRKGMKGWTIGRRERTKRRKR